MTSPPREVLDYDQYARTYAWARWAVPWVLAPLEQLLSAVPANGAVLEIGCGTGNYIRTLAERHPDLFCAGLDLSQPMLNEAQKAGPQMSYVVGNAARDFPYCDRAFAVAFAVDVIHHIADVARFFAETCRVLAPAARLAIVTDSTETLARRSLTAFFPELLPIELARYRALPVLHQAAARAGLQLLAHGQVSGQIPLSGEFLARLQAKCSSAMRQISESDHAAGMARVRAAQARGEVWISCYDVIHYGRSEREDG